MNFFLKKGNYTSRNSSDRKLKLYNKFTKSEKNRLYLLNDAGKEEIKKEKLSHKFLKIPNESQNFDGSTKTGYIGRNIITERNIIRKSAFNNDSYNITSEDDRLLKQSNKSLNKIANSNLTNPIIQRSVKTRNTIINIPREKIDKSNDILPQPKYTGRSVNKYQTLTRTLLTSIPVDKRSSKKISKYLNSKLSSHSRFKLRKQYYDLMKLRDLKMQIKKFENSKAFLPNEKIIEKYNSSPERYISKKYQKIGDSKKRVKIYPICKSKLFSTEEDNYTLSTMKANTPKHIYETMNTLEKESETNRKDILNSKKDLNYERTNEFKKALKKFNTKNEEVKEYLMEIALEYRKGIGEFTLHNGKGIYTKHLEKIIKNEKLLNFMPEDTNVDKNNNNNN